MKVDLFERGPSEHGVKQKEAPLPFKKKTGRERNLCLLKKTRGREVLPEYYQRKNRDQTNQKVAMMPNKPGRRTERKGNTGGTFEPRKTECRPKENGGIKGGKKVSCLRVKKPPSNTPMRKSRTARKGTRTGKTYLFYLFKGKSGRKEHSKKGMKNSREEKRKESPSK